MSELNREQVESHLDSLLLSHGIVLDMAVIENLADTDAALRQQVEALQAENNLMAAHQGIDNYQRCLTTIADLQQQLAKYEARLEIDQVFDMDGKRVEIPPAERHKQIDGIDCRDETIKLQDEAVDRLKQQLAAVTKDRDEARKVRRGYDEWLSKGVYYTTEEYDQHIKNHEQSLTAARQALADEQELRMKAETKWLEGCTTINARIAAIEVERDEAVKQNRRAYDEIKDHLQGDYDLDLVPAMRNFVSSLEGREAILNRTFQERDKWISDCVDALARDERVRGLANMVKEYNVWLVDTLEWCLSYGEKGMCAFCDTAGGKHEEDCCGIEGIALLVKAKAALEETP